MTTNVKVFKSTDAGASGFTLYGSIPSTTGGAGSMIGILRACLITGYNSITATSVVVASNVATVNYTAHGFLSGQCLLVAGATPSGLNGEIYVVSATANSFTYTTTGISDQTATGTITIKMAPAGWVEPYTATTNITCFRQGGGNQFYLNIDETAAQCSRTTGFESMTAVGIANGTGSFPTSSQQTGGLYWNRSSVTDTSTRNWVVIATDRVLYFWTNPNITNASTGLDATLQCMSDIKSYKTGDIYATRIVGGVTSSVGTNCTALQTNVNIPNNGQYLARSYTQIGSSTASGQQHIDSNSLNNTYMGNSSMTYPVAVDNGLWMSGIRVNEGNVNAPRGELPGIWAPMHLKPLNHFDTFTGSGTLAGKQFLVINGYSSGQIMVETSNTWSI